MSEMSQLPGMTEADRELRAALQEQRRQIAENVERLGCGKLQECDWRGPSIENPYRSGDGVHEDRCPLAVAAGIREGRL